MTPRRHLTATRATAERGRPGMIYGPLLGVVAVSTFGMAAVVIHAATAWATLLSPPAFHELQGSFMVGAALGLAALIMALEASS